MPLRLLTPEASTRRYFRPQDPSAAGWLLVRWDQPAPVAPTAWLRAAGVRVPALGPSVPGAYLVEDLGDAHLAQDPRPEHYAALLEQARRIGVAALPPGHPNARLALDTDLFRRELRMFRELYLQGFRARARAPAEESAADRACERLADEAARGPWRVQHRDLHSRNVMLPPGGGVALIDHQDLRPGPFLYDVASLSTDAYTDLPEAVEAMLEAEVRRAGAAAGLDPGETSRRFWCTALQRVLKALGTFGRLIASGRGDYREAERRARRHALRLLEQRDDHAIFRELVG